MKRVLSLVLAFMLVLTSILPAFAEETAAADSQAALDLQSYGVIAGTDKGLDEASALTRAQMATILADLYGMKEEASTHAFKSSFTDVEEGMWYTPYVAFAETQGWMSGMGDGTFAPNEVMTAQQVNALFVKALGYTVEWADVNAKAEELEIAVDAADETLVLRGEAFATMRAMLDVPKMDETDTFGTSLGLTNYVAPAPEAPATVAITGAVAVNSKVVEVSLDSDLDAPTAVTADQFVVTDKDAAAVAVASVEFAPWDADMYTVLVTLEADTTAGSLYTVTSGEESANFGGMAADETKPTISKVESADYNEVEITFSEAVVIDGLTVEIAEKYGDKAELAVTNIEYLANNKVKLTTADQKGSTLYTTTVEGAADLAENAMTKDTAKTFVGKAKPTAKQSLEKITAVTSTSVDVFFNQKVDETAAVEVANYEIAMKYGDKTEVEVVEAEVRALTTAEKATYKAGQIVRLTLATDTSAATLYNVTVTNVGSVYGTDLAASQAKTFVGLAKDTTKLAAPTAASTSNTTMTLTFGTADEKDYVNEATTADMITITEKYGDKAELAITDFSISKNVIKLTTTEQKSATLYEVVIATGIMDKAGNATTAELKTTVVGKGVATKISDITSATLDSAGTTLTVVFNKNVDATQAVDISHYEINNSVGYPTKATYSSTTPDTVKLTVPKTTEGKIYTLTVKNLNNSDGVAMADAGVKETFVGKGVAATLPVIEAVLATDAQTIKVIFDRDVTGSDIAGKVWNSTAGTLIADTGVDRLTYTVDGTTYINIAGAKAYQSTVDGEENVLIIRSTSATAFKAATATTSDDTFKLKANKSYIKGTDGADTTLVFAFNDTAASKVEIVSVMAVDAQTIRVYFNMPVQTPNAGFAKVALAAADTFGTGTNLTLSNPTKYDGNAAIWNFKLSAAMTTNTSHYFIVDPTVTTGELADTAGVVTLKDEDTSVTNVQHEREFAGTSTAATAITDVYAVMTDKNTIVVYYPEAMNATEAKDLTNYAVVNATTGLLAEKTTAQPVISADINTAGTEVTLHLGAAIDTAATNVYLVISSDVNNATQSVSLKADKTGLTALNGGSTQTGLVKEFAKSTTAPAGPAIASITLDDDRMGMTIKMDKPVAFDAATPTLSFNAANNTPANDEFANTGDTMTNFSKTQFDDLFVINGQLVGDSAAGTITTATATRSDNGKSFHVTFASALKPSTEGYVTTEKTSALYIFDRTNTAAAKTNADASKMTFGVPASAQYDGTAPTATTVTNASNNATTTVAKVGDNVILTIVANENVTLSAVDVEVNGTDAATAEVVAGSGNSWTITTPMASGDANGNVTFSFVMTDGAGNTTTVNALTAGSAVVFDKTAPVDVATANVVITNVDAVGGDAAANQDDTVALMSDATNDAWAASGMADGFSMVFTAGTEVMTYVLQAGDFANLDATTNVTLTIDLDGSITGATFTNGSGASTIAAFDAAITDAGTVNVKLVDLAGNESTGINVTVATD